MTAKPTARPARAHFSSGPCAKRPGYDLSTLPTDSLGRSHRAKIGKTRLKDAIDRTRAVLGVPEDYRIGIVPASDTGAYEMAMWSLLGAKPVTAVAWESFGEGWVTDAVKQLKLDATVRKSDYGQIVDLTEVDFDKDVVFTWNGTTSGLRVPNADFIAAARLQGAGRLRLLIRHIWPLCLSSLIVRVALDMAGIILSAAGLGFLGLGAQPPLPEWGAMIATGRRYMIDSWWLVTFPGLAILTVSLAFNLLGDGLRDALDPKQMNRR